MPTRHLYRRRTLVNIPAGRPLRSNEVLAALGLTLRPPCFRPARPAALPAANRPALSPGGRLVQKAPSDEDPTLEIFEWDLQPPAKRKTESTVDPRAYDSEIFGKLAFPEASRLWLESRRVHLKTSTFVSYENQVNQLSRYFAHVRVKDIRPFHLKAYQEERTTNSEGRWAAPASATIVNHELMNLGQILSRAELWAPLATHYEPLPIAASRQRKVLSDKEEERFVRVAASRPEWALALQVAVFTLNAGASGTELRHLRIENIFLDGEHGAPAPFVRIPDEGAKNEWRARKVLLNSEAVRCMRWFLDRAKRLGCRWPADYVFPKRTSPGKWDPAQPTSASWLRRAWYDLRKAAGMPWLTPHCFRHLHITLLYELGIPEPLIQEMVGHTSARMSRHYNHPRDKERLAAVKRLEPQSRHAIAARGRLLPMQGGSRRQCNPDDSDS